MSCDCLANVDFDELSDAERDKIPYKTMQTSFRYVADMILGNTNTAPFTYGNKSHENVFLIIYWLSAFIIMIHLLNMLIAIMGNTFSNRNEVQDQVRYKDHLSFVLDNWFMVNYTFK